MLQLSISAATDYVRKTLDELTSVEEIGMLVSPDAVDIHKLVEKSIIEVVVRIHNLAPSGMLEGVQGTAGTDYTLGFIENDVISILMNKETLRMVSVSVADSAFVVTEFIPEDSPEGHMQRNPYTRGVPDDPKVVIKKVPLADRKPTLRYYTSSEKSHEAVSLTYIPYPVIENESVIISPSLEYAVLNELTAMVLDSVNEHEKAALYRGKAMSLIGQ